MTENRAVDNQRNGFAVYGAEGGCVENTLTRNVGKGSAQWDALDENPPGSNSWAGNTFGKSSPPDSEPGLRQCHARSEVTAWHCRPSPPARLELPLLDPQVAGLRNRRVSKKTKRLSRVLTSARSRRII